MSHAPPLVLLTSAFPFGRESEPFLEAEIPVLARRFRRVYLLPSHRAPGMRPLPENVQVVEMPWLDGYSRRARLRALAAPRAVAIGVGALLVPGNPGPYLQHRRMYADLLARNLLKARDLRRFLQERGLGDAVGYDYWFENSTLALGLARARGDLRVAVSRAHGFDVYDERWDGGRVPFRRAKARRLDRVFVVSAYGADYLRGRLGAEAARVETAYLGVPREEPAPVAAVGTAPGFGGAAAAAVVAPEGGDPLVVTCSRLHEGKRVHLVPRVLARLEVPVRWVHLGDGPERGRVEAEARRWLGAGGAWRLPGHLPNADVLRFYRHRRVGAFLSVSRSEGLPVSMMEAIRSGVPVVAVGVQGIPELVDDTTGVLLPPDAGPAEVAAGLTRALRPRAFDRDRIRTVFRDRFQAETNHEAFADALLDLWRARSGTG
jgi:glycosyltransferase involved in cell wall biosynthesis